MGPITYTLTALLDITSNQCLRISTNSKDRDLSHKFSFFFNSVYFSHFRCPFSLFSTTHIVNSNMLKIHYFEFDDGTFFMLFKHLLYCVRVCVCPSPSSPPYSLYFDRLFGRFGSLSIVHTCHVCDAVLGSFYLRLKSNGIERRCNMAIAGVYIGIKIGEQINGLHVGIYYCINGFAHRSLRRNDASMLQQRIHQTEK